MQTRTSERKGERFSSQRQEEGRSLLALSMKMLLSLPSLSPFTPLLAFLSFESCSHALFNQEERRQREREKRHEWSRDGEERLREGRRVQGSREERQEAKRRRRLIGSIDEANERSNSSLW